MKNLVILFSTVFMSAGAMALTTQEVWQHHIDAWVNRDLDAIVSDYDHSSVMILNNRVYKGQGEIREVFKNLFLIFDQGSNQITPATIEGRVIFITWRFTPIADRQYLGTDTFIIEKGKIKVQTIASDLYDRADFNFK